MNIYEKEIDRNLIQIEENMKLYSKKKKKKKTTNKLFKKRIDTHLLYTCKYFQIIYF
jgi:hypothetical protein